MERNVKKMFAPFFLLPSAVKWVYDKLNENESEISASYGDVIGVRRWQIADTNLQIYKHYGIYAGDNLVIHFAPDESGERIIHETTMEKFLDGKQEYFICHFPEVHGSPTEENIKNYSIFYPCPNQLIYRKIKDFFNGNKDYRLYSPQETVSRARGKIGKKGYSVITNNCEHFAIWCKTGIAESRQVNDLLDIVEGIVISVKL